MKSLRVKLVMDTWSRFGKDVYHERPELSRGQFHSGTTFDGTIDLPEDDLEELKESIRSGYNPSFFLYLE